MKKEAREEARRLRRDEGLSVKEICKRLGVAKSSVSVWVRDIELTAEQRNILEIRKQVRAGQEKGAITNRRLGLERRRAYQQSGRVKAREKDPLHIAGCMLYWGEGHKTRNKVQFSNSDVGMNQLFMRFLRECFDLDDITLRISINCYLNNGLSEYEIEEYWLNALGLPRDVLIKTIVNQPKSSQQKGRKLLYGVCSIYAHSTLISQHILGAIQEYAGIEKPEWLF